MACSFLLFWLSIPMRSSVSFSQTFLQVIGLPESYLTRGALLVGAILLYLAARKLVNSYGHVEFDKLLGRDEPE